MVPLNTNGNKLYYNPTGRNALVIGFSISISIALRYVSLAVFPNIFHFPSVIFQLLERTTKLTAKK